MHSIGLKGLNTFMSFDAPSLAHAYSVVRHLYDGWAVHIRQKGVHGRSKLVSWLGLSVQVRVRVKANDRDLVLFLFVLY